MTRFTLTAEQNGRRDSRDVLVDQVPESALRLADGDEAQAVQFDATMSAIKLVLDLAHDDPQGIWAKGRIELRDASGSLLHVMGEKP